MEMILNNFGFVVSSKQAVCGRKHQKQAPHLLRSTCSWLLLFVFTSVNNNLGNARTQNGLPYGYLPTAAPCGGW